jgi:hypothetical protein
MRIFPVSMLIAITAVLALGQNDTAKEPFTVVINVETPIVKAGSGVSVNGRLTNISNQPLDTSGCNCGPSGLDSYLTCEVRDDKCGFRKIWPHSFRKFWPV